jgi:hypothetical protein
MGVQITKRETTNAMEINTYCLVNYSLRNILYKAKNICYYGYVPSTAKTDVCPTEYEKYWFTSDGASCSSDAWNPSKSV